MDTVTKSAKIAFFIPYFGKWPEYFDFYLYTCSKNPIIDFYYFTDCPIPQKIYPNTHFKSITFSEYCKKVSSILKINFFPQNPYKLADLKPFYSVIHNDIASQYEFWGFGDIDLIYGDIRLILSEKNLKRYNVFSTHIDRISGHFCVLRYKKYNEVGYKIKNWQEYLSDEKNCVVDENYLARIIYPEQRIRRGLKRYIKHRIFQQLWNIPIPTWIQWCLKKYEQEWHTTTVPTQDSKYIYRANKIYDCLTQNELPYLHFLFFKGRSTCEHKVSHKWPQSYYQLTANDFEQTIIVDWDKIATLSNKTEK